jgi:hypothetical protein
MRTETVMAFFRITRCTDVLLLGLLAAAVLICVVAISPVIWTAMKEVVTYQVQEDPRACLAIKDDTERLHCLETRVGRDMPPARGAFAPRSTFGGKDPSGE